MTQLFDDLADSSKLWVFSSAQSLDNSQVTQIDRELGAFENVWKAHGVPVQGQHAVLYNRFVLVAANSEATDVSGCSIDSLFKAMAKASDLIGVPLGVSSDVFFKDNGDVKSLDQEQFQKLVDAGKVSANTTVFNNSVTTLEALRNGQWETSAKDSWHARKFGIK